MHASTRFNARSNQRLAAQMRRCQHQSMSSSASFGFSKALRLIATNDCRLGCPWRGEPSDMSSEAPSSRGELSDVASCATLLVSLPAFAGSERLEPEGGSACSSATVVPTTYVRARLMAGSANVRAPTKAGSASDRAPLIAGSAKDRALLRAGSARDLALERAGFAALYADTAVLPTMSFASKAASLKTPRAPFSRNSWTVSCRSCFRPSKSVPSSPWLSLPSPSAASAPASAASAMSSGACWPTGTRDRAPRSADAAVLPTRSTASSEASFTAPRAPFSRNSCTVLRPICLKPPSKPGSSCVLFSSAAGTSELPALLAGCASELPALLATRDRAPLSAELAVLPTILAASIATSFTAPTAPFSRKSWTVLRHSCLRPSNSEAPSASPASLVPS
mmetsp:Transcript_47070/g.84976  ORF Transcript_47070/g.84976 Transcript_47070/m.84976 type:complete len:394 (-) Transcript_47070:192-1373(-)